MSGSEWQKVKAIFNSAVELSPENRAAYLADACGANDVLRKEVEKLLDSYRSEFMEVPAGKDTSNGRLTPGTTVGRYEIVDLLGVGGMGEVYLASDTQLDRKVAIKVLNEKYKSHESNILRFIREAKAASALNHPNILVIHEIGESADSHYIVSEYVNGKTLREILNGRKLSVSETLDITIQVASALAAAHAARIVHRDIKPENIVVRADGYVKVLDFGLAKLIPSQRSFVGVEDEAVRQNKTAEGLILGTVSYMSPEQAKGESVDERTDIFSLGVLLYEMLAGRTPFTADSTSQTIANLINGDPAPLSRYALGIPEDLQRIVSKMLRKKPDERYQTMKGLIADLKELKDRITLETKPGRSSAADSANTTDVLINTTGDGDRKTAESTGEQGKRRLAKFIAVSAAVAALITTAWYLQRAASRTEPRIRSLTVLPLKSLDSGENYLGLGIADAVIRRISQTGQLTVRPTSAVRKFLTEDTDAIAAAQQLSTDAVLEGSVQHADDRLRISVNLLRTSDGVSIWSDNFDMHSADIFTIQDSVAQQVVSKLRLKLDPDQTERLKKHATSNQLAYDYYLKGVYSFDQRTWGEKAKPQAEATADLFKNAIAADPNFALAHAQLANVYAYIAILIDSKDPIWAERAREEIARAESLDPTLAESHTARGTLLIGSHSGYQWEAGIREFLAAAQIDPNVAHMNLGGAYYHIGLEDLADREFQRALEIDPTSKTNQTEYTLFFLNLRRYEEFDAVNQKYFPDDPPTSDSLIASGRLDEAQKLIDQEMKDYSDNPWTHAEYAIFLGLKGDRVGAEASIQDAIKLLDRDNLTYHHMTYEIACAYAVLNKTEEAMKWLRVTADTGFPCYPAFQRDVYLDRMRGNPQFVQFMAEMKSLNEKYRNEFQ